MKIKIILLLLLVAAMTQCKKEQESNILPLSNAIDYYHGHKIEDPYRSLENLEDSTTINWLKNQKNASDTILYSNYGMVKMQKSIAEKKSNNEIVISKIKIANNDSHFYLKRLRKEKVAQLYVRKGFSGEERLLYNPKNFNSPAGNSYTINYIQPSWDGNKIVIGLTKNDEEYSKLLILDVKTKKIISNHLTNALPNSLGGVEWLPNDNGIIYTYTPITDTKSKEYSFNSQSVVYYLNQNEENLKDLFSRKSCPNIEIKPEDFPIVYYTYPSNQFILGAIAGVSAFRDTYYQKIEGLSKKKWKKLYGKEEKIRQFFLYKNNFYFRTAKDASNFKICKTNLQNPDFKNPEVLVQEDTNSVVSDFEVTKDGIYYVKTRNGVEAKLFFRDHKNAQELSIELPKPSGYISLSSKGIDYSELLIATEGWINAKETFLYDYQTKKFETRNILPVIKHEFLNDIVVQEIEITSHDGIKVPLSIIYNKETKLDGQNRILINAYGAYKWSNSPYLYNYLLHWIEEGGIYATAHVRGGGEKGDNWHIGGYKTTKPNSWKDLISCTEYLINNNYTNKDKVALWGASAGGITIGRAITERPDLYKAAVIRVGSLNMLRSEFGSNGKNNIKEFGTVKDSTEFRSLLEMDAYHHLKKDVHYPAVFLTAGMNDARVPAWQPAKFAIKLQEVTSSNNPVLFDVDFEGGHGFDALANKRDIELAKIMTFLLWQTGHPDYEPKN